MKKLLKMFWSESQKRWNIVEKFRQQHYEMQNSLRQFPETQNTNCKVHVLNRSSLS